MPGNAEIPQEILQLAAMRKSRFKAPRIVCAELIIKIGGKNLGVLEFHRSTKALAGALSNAVGLVGVVAAAVRLEGKSPFTLASYPPLQLDERLRAEVPQSSAGNLAAEVAPVRGGI